MAGKVLIQALNLEHPCLESVKTHDFLGYARQELEMRQTALYPPFVRLVQLRSLAKARKSKRWPTSLARYFVTI